MSKKLKPCPFCGKEARLEHWKYNGEMVYEIKCSDLNCPVPVVRHPIGYDLDEVIAKWNDRTDTSDMLEMTAVLDRMIRSKSME